jgi:kynurenine formamidase
MTQRGWRPPNYTVDEHDKIVGREPPAPPHNWGRWGEHDEKGTANFLSPHLVAEAGSLIKKGIVYSLALPIQKGGPVHPGRSDIVHLYAYSGADFIAGTTLNERAPRFQGSDDYIFMPLQGSTQWDALAHCGFDDALYNGFWLGKVEAYAGATRGSIHHLRETMIGRGALLDLARHQGVERLLPGHAITADELDACAASQGLEIRSGDMLLLRTGHVAWYYQLADKREFWRDGAPGLGKTTVEWAHRNELAALAVDNVGVEVEPFEEPYDVIYPLHVRFIRDLGLILGELFWLEELAEACAADREYSFFLSAPPLNVTNASGSPLNPIAIK